jgi:WD40 repeat protein
MDAELARLPEHYRNPLILCYLEGLTQAEAAQRLGWSAGVLRGRLERGRQALRRRLERHGFLAAAPLLLLAAPASVSAALRTATLTTVGAGLTGGSVPPAVSVLVTGALSPLGAAELTALAGLVLVAVVVGFGIVGANGPGAAPLIPADLPAAALVGTPNVQVDRLGDPLPVGALRRLGTTRHRMDYFPPHTDYRFLSDDKSLLSYSLGEIRWSEAATGRRLASWTLPDSMTACGFSVDGRLALLRHRESLQIWDLVTRKATVPLTVPAPVDGQVIAYFSPDNRFLATTANYNFTPGFLQVWDVKTGRELWHEGKLRASPGRMPLGFLPDGQTLAVMHYPDDRLRFHELRTGRVQREFSVPRLNAPGLSVVKLSPDGKTLLTPTGAPTICAWDVETGQELPPLKRQGQGDSRSVLVFSPDGRRLLYGGNSPFVEVWDWPARRLLRKFELGAHSLERMHVLPDGRWTALTGWGQNGLRFFDLETGQERPPLTEGHCGPITGVAIARDGKIVSGGGDNTIRIWDLHSGRHLQVQLGGHMVGVMGLALSADAQLVATVDMNESQIRVRDRATGRLLRTLGTAAEWLRTVTFGPEGRLLASAGRGRDHQTTIAQLWDADSGRECWRREVASWYAPTFSPDGRQLAGFSNDQIVFRETATGTELAALHFQNGIGLAYSPTGRTLACRDPEGITLVELASGGERCRVPVARDPTEVQIGLVRFSPDGRWLAAGGKHGVVHVCERHGSSSIAKMWRPPGKVWPIRTPRQPSARCRY